MSRAAYVKGKWGGKKDMKKYWEITRLVFDCKTRKQSTAIIVLMLIMLSFTSANGNARSISAPVDTLQYATFPFVRFVDPEAPAVEPLSDEEFLDKAGLLVFRINQYDAFTNDSLLTLLEREVLPLVNRDSLRLVRMVLRSAASPDGPYRNNVKLGHRRAQMVYDFLKERLAVPFDETVLSADVVSEDYRLLLVMMRRAGDRDADLVQQLCDRHLPNNEYTLLKNELQAIKGGSLWQRLLKAYFPQLRAARMMLYFEKKSAPRQDSQETYETSSVQETNQTDQTYVPDVPDTAKEEPTVPVMVRVPRRELLAIKTNLLFDFAYMPGYNRWCPIPNVALEFYPLRGHFTVGASFDCPWWQDYDAHKYFQIRNYQVEGRYYFRSGSISKNPPGEGPAFRGLYLSAYAHLGLFGICFDEDSGWEGEGVGGGLGFGYVQRLGKKGHWRLEFGAQVGFLRCKYDPYQYENPVNPALHDNLYYYKWTGKPELFRERQYRFTWIGPTRVGITLSYDLLYRRQAKKGFSFKNHEYREK